MEEVVGKRVTGNNEPPPYCPPSFDDNIEYYRRFHDATRGCEVLFLDDWNESLENDVVDKRLTNEEIQILCNQYTSVINVLYNEYGERTDYPTVTTQEDILCQRVVAPTLRANSGTTQATGRSSISESKAKRVYPPKIYQWKTFHSDVNDHKIRDAKPFEEDLSTIFYDSLASANRFICGSEACEETCLRANLSVLVKSGILHEDQSKKGAIGRPDFCFATEDNNKFTMFCECKSTQNLLLPKTAKECVTIYNKAFNDVEASRKRTKGWYRVNHPVAQLIGYMVDNRCRYGVLTSGTRSYFIGIVGNENDSQVQISNAWFVGQKNYLRAWAYIYKKGKDDDEWNPPNKWIQTTTIKGQQTPDVMPKKISGGQGEGEGDNTESDSGGNNATDEQDSSSRKRTAASFEPKTDRCHKNTGSPNSTIDINDSTQNTTTTPSTNIILEYYQNCHNCDLLQDVGIFLPFVPIQHIKILDVLGSGRNGSTFLVTWNDIQYAMKQYDVGKNRDDTCTYFKNEMLAYQRLQTVWGTLIPKPIFISESLSGGVLFFGIQLGRKITEEDMNKGDFVLQFKEIFERLKKEYNIEHNDIDGTNVIYITDNETDVEKLVVIDFEDWYDL